MDSLRRVLTVEPEPIAQLLPRLHRGFADLVSALLSKDPAARPASAHQVAERLSEIASSLNDRSAEADDEPFADPDSPTAEMPSPRRPVVATTANTSRQVLRTVVHAAAATAGQDADEALGRRARRLLTRFNAWEAVQAESVFLFQRPAEAVAFALLLHRALGRKICLLFDRQP